MINNIPVKFAGGATVFLKDVGNVRDGNLVQQNVVRENGRRPSAQHHQER